MDPIVTSLVLALGAAFVGAVIAVRLGQSAIIGFIFAGIAIGPYTPGLTGDPGAVDALADIGIILLLFAIGVQLSVPDLLQAGRVAILGGSLQVAVLIGAGLLIGIALGWGPLEAFAFGAVVSNSSSTVLGKVLGDRGELNTIQGRIGLAWSTVQDLSTIVLIVVLTALASDDGSLWTELASALAMAAVFLVILLPVGSKLLPWLFEHLATLQNREVFLMAVALFALGTAYLTTYFGLSVALGAFLAGVIVSESDLWHQILGEILPLRDIFAGLFFVSVGMLVDPAFILDAFPLVLIGAATIIVLKGLIVTGITLLFQYPLRAAMLTGVTLAQSAEFSFLLARIGVDEGAVSARVFNLILAASVISIILSPGLHRLANAAAIRLEQRIPGAAFAHAMETDQPPTDLDGHTIICGYGRVGSRLGVILQRFGFPFVVIDQNARTVGQLREQGVPVFFGAIDNPIVLERAGIAHARILVLAIPDVIATRRTVDFAQQANPDLTIVARTHSDEERRYLTRRGVSEAAEGEFELALEMTRFTLSELDVDRTETRALLEQLRRHETDDWERAVIDRKLDRLPEPGKPLKIERSEQ